jgi:argininosuccinate lyase
VVSQAVRAVGPVYSPEHMVEEVERLAPEILGRPLSVSRQELRRALDAENFVRARTVAGGPAPQTVSAEIDAARREQLAFTAWLEKKQDLLQRYPGLFQEAARLLMK